jgi:hypothetical protein
MNGPTRTWLRLFEKFCMSSLSSYKDMCFCKISVTITPLIKFCCVETDVDPYNSLCDVSEK